MSHKGFTLIELLVAIAIIAIISAIVLFSITQYINKSKDASIEGNLAVLIPAGEVYYDHNDGNGYEDFCSPDLSAIKNANSSVPLSADSPCLDDNLLPVICCNESANAWAACALKFSDTSKAVCVDSRGIKREISADLCGSEMGTICPEE